MSVETLVPGLFCTLLADLDGRQFLYHRFTGERVLCPDLCRWCLERDDEGDIPYFIPLADDVDGHWCADLFRMNVYFASGQLFARGPSGPDTMVSADVFQRMHTSWVVGLQEGGDTPMKFMVEDFRQHLQGRPVLLVADRQGRRANLAAVQEGQVHCLQDYRQAHEGMEKTCTLDTSSSCSSRSRAERSRDDH